MPSVTPPSWRRLGDRGCWRGEARRAHDPFRSVLTDAPRSAASVLAMLAWSSRLRRGGLGTLGDMSATLSYRWSPEGFLRAWEADAFDRRVEMVDGEVIPVVIGDWHGEVTARLIRCLPDAGVEITTQTLPIGHSLPDPDCWVRRASASPIGHLSNRLSQWATEDILLVVEVADETKAFDLSDKAVLYARAGLPVYWVVTHEGVHEHTGPTASGYEVRTLHPPPASLPVPFADASVSVSELLGPG